MTLPVTRSNHMYILRQLFQSPLSPLFSYRVAIFAFMKPRATALEDQLALTILKYHLQGSLSQLLIALPESQFTRQLYQVEEFPPLE